MTKLTKKRNSGETLYLSKSLLSICFTEMARKNKIKETNGIIKVNINLKVIF